MNYVVSGDNLLIRQVTWKLHPLPDAWALNETVEVRLITLFNETDILEKYCFPLLPFTPHA